MKKFVIASLVTLIAGAASAQEVKHPDPAGLDEVIKSSFSKMPKGWESRFVQDETQHICSVYHDNPPSAEMDKIQKAETAKIKLPADGKVIGDWKAGEKIAYSGKGGRIKDKPGTVNGGNCYACHQIDPKEITYGTLGPSLAGYGRIRNYSAEDAKTAFTKIYDSKATVACSAMPRFGASGFLSEQQIKDVVAYLFDPASPVNKK